MKKRNEIADRIFKFVTKVIIFTRCLPEKTEYKVIQYQLVKSAGSVGANYEEAQSGSSTADFIYKIEISLREMRETKYWLRLIKEIIRNASITERKELDYLIDESEQLTKILGAIVVKVKKRTYNTKP